MCCPARVFTCPGAKALHLIRPGVLPVAPPSPHLFTAFCSFCAVLSLHTSNSHPPLPADPLLCPRSPQSIDNVPVFRGEDALRADGTGTFSQDSSRFQQSRLPQSDDEYGFAPVAAYDEQVGVGGATGLRVSLILFSS